MDQEVDPGIMTIIEISLTAYCPWGSILVMLTCSLPVTGVFIVRTSFALEDAQIFARQFKTLAILKCHDQQAVFGAGLSQPGFFWLE